MSELSTDTTLAAGTDPEAANEHTRGTAMPASVSPGPRIRSRTLLPPGTVVGRYHLAERLGAGGMGVVYRARDPRLDREVAVKLVAVAGLEDAQARLEREAQAMAKLSHPNVCAVHDIGTWDNQLFIAMELCPGGTLSAWTASARRPWREIVAQYIAAGRGLAAAHALGIIHRDFKPDNVMLGADGAVKVTDFGLAPARDDLHGTIEGTPAFMSPEQLEGEQLDARSDQFAFAVALWSALCRTLPYQPDRKGADAFDAMLLAIRNRRRTSGEGADCPERILTLLERALEPEPDARWPSLTALLDRLERASASRKRTYLIAGGFVGAAGVAAMITKLALAPATPYDGPELERDPYFFYLADHADLVDRSAEIYEAGYARAKNPAFLLAEARMYLQVGDCAAFPLIARYQTTDNILPRDVAALREKYDWMCNSPYGMHDADDFEKKAEMDIRLNPMMAIPEFREAARMAPNRPELWYKLAETEASMGYCTLAKQHYERFLRTLPTEAARVDERQGVEANLERCEPSDMELMPDYKHATPLVPPP